MQASQRHVPGPGIPDDVAAGNDDDVARGNDDDVAAVLIMAARSSGLMPCASYTSAFEEQPECTQTKHTREAEC